MNLPALRLALKASPACACCARKASRTSAPTSKDCGPMAGPSQTSSSPGSTPMAATVFSSTPPASPRQPAWAAATRLPARSQNSAGRQSAVSTAQATPGVAVQLASATGTSAGSAATTSGLCTCFSHAGRQPRRSTSRARLAATAAGASSTWSPRLRLSKGAGLVPPARVVTQAHTRDGAGQSGSSQSDKGFIVLAQQRQQPDQILGQRRLPLHALAGGRVLQLEEARVQGLARELPQGLHQGRTGRRRDAEAPRVERVAYQRIAGMGHVHTDLVGTP